MYEDEDYRNNYYEDDDFDGRNALFRRSRRRRRPPVAMVPVPVQQASPRYMAPWQPPPPAPPLLDRFTGNIKLGMVLDAAAQVLASMAGLPAAPIATDDAKVNMANLIEYQTKLAQHAKRDEQIRTAGALAKLFLV